MICDVYIFQNGMCAVFDEHGEQMESYQGLWTERRDKILADAPAECRFFRAVWGVSAEEVKRKEL
jgi:hypothetical protein